MNKKKLIDNLGWGFTLWLIGYFLGVLFFMVVPQNQIGWFITPIGIAITLFVLFKKIKSTNFNYYLMLGVSWTAIAVFFDYLFIVKAFNPADGYYKFDVYLYYAFTFLLPILAGFLKSRKN